MTLTKKQAIIFNGANATWIDLIQSANGMKYLKQILIFGDDKSTFLVNGIYPESAKQIEEKVKESLLSIVYDELQNDDALAAANFTIHVDTSDFKLVKYMSGSLLFSTDGKIPTEKPTFIAGSSFSKISIADQTSFATERIKKLPKVQQLSIKETNTVRIDDLQGVEIIANNTKGASDIELLYQVILFTPEGDYFILIGQSKEQMGKYIDLFRNIAKTFKRK